MFGEIADLYDRLRPSFPDSLVRELAEVAELGNETRVLEVGAGTGKLTVMLAQYGCDILALEPSAEMAAVLRRNCDSFPVTVLDATFEDADLESSSFHLVVAAQSWHWLDADVRERKAAELLRPGGVLAVVWNVGDVESMPFHNEIDAVYADLAPHMTHASLMANWQRENEPRDWLDGSEDFTSVTVSSHRWSRRLTTHDYVDLLSTHSHHRMLDPALRRRLVDEIAIVVDSHGGEIEEFYDAILFTARRSS